MVLTLPQQEFDEREERLLRISRTWQEPLGKPS